MRLLGFEERKMDAAVALFFDEERVLPKGVLGAVFKDEIALRVKDSGIKDKVRERLKPLKGIRRVCKDKVELLCTERDKIKDIVAHHSKLVRNAKLPGSI